MRSVLAMRIPSEHPVEASSVLLLTYAAGAVVGPMFATAAMEELGPGGLFASTAFAHVLFALFVVYRMSQRAAIPADERDNFVLMETRTSAVVFELDPRSEATSPEVAEEQAAEQVLEDDLPDGEESDQLNPEAAEAKA